MRAANLYFQDGASDKTYSINLQAQGDGFIVRCAFGRRGATQQVQEKTKAPVALAEAEKIYQRTLIEKLAKGYLYAPGTTQATAPKEYTTPPGWLMRDAFLTPMLLNEIDEAAALALIKNDGWLMQEKHDGIRCQLHRIGGRAFGFSRTGRPLALCTELEAAILMQPDTFGDFVIDGELTGPAFYAFDVLKENGDDIREEPYEFRYCVLSGMSFGGCFQRSMSFGNFAEKRAAYILLHGKGAEGVVLKKKGNYHFDSLRLLYNYLRYSSY